VDIVDRDARTTVASLTSAEALALMTEMLSATTGARENRLLGKSGLCPRSDKPGAGRRGPA
jgi:hypothetical protein